MEFKGSLERVRSKRLNNDRRIIDPCYVHIQCQHSGHAEPVFATNSTAKEPKRHIVLPRPRFGISDAFWRVTSDHATGPAFDDPLLAFTLTQIREPIGS